MLKMILVIIATSASTSANSTSVPDLVKVFLQFFWVPIMVPIVIFVAKKIFSRIITVKEIKNTTDRDIAGFKKLYNKRIHEGLRIEAEEILKFIGRQNNTTVEHHLCICKNAGKVVGFIKYIVSHPQKCIFVAYIAIDNTNSVVSASGVKKMLKHILHKHFNPNKAQIIVTEIEQGEQGQYNTPLAKIIARHAAAYKMDAFYIDVPYIQPKMPGAELHVTDERFMSLIYIPYYKPENDFISKEEIIQIIEFVYFDVYGPSCNEVKCDCGAYTLYLKELIKTYKTDYAEYVSLKKLGRQ